MKPDHPTLISAQGESLVLRSVHAQGRLEGLLLSMTLRQVFRNDQSRNLEVTYTFPLAWGAVLIGMEARLGDKRMTGQVMARQEARERYEQAVEKGDAPIMVEKAQGGVFSASLGSLKPGEEAVIDIIYAQLLSFEGDRVRLVVPTTIAPRYGDAINQAGLSPDQVATPDLLAEHRFGLSVTLTGYLAQTRIGSPTHAVTQQRHHDAGNEAVTVSLQMQAWLDRDFVLLLEGLQGRSFAIAGPDSRSGENHQALIASYCPALPGTSPEPLRLKILVDCSGSMAGQSIEQARDALRPLAAQLTQQDRVSYTRFGSRPQRVLEAVNATPRHVQALIDAISETHADLGGTEMADALEDTFCLRMAASRHAGEADVLIITDGAVWDAQHIVDSARRSGHRIYALGVGSASAESLLREMAEATGGACEFAAPEEDMGEAIQRLLTRVRQTLPIQMQVAIADEALWLNPLPRRLAAGETVHVFMRLRGKIENPPLLELTGQKAVAAELSFRTDDLVARLVAAREIGTLTQKTEIRALATRYGLVSDETNLLLVIERAEADKTNGMPALHKVQPMLAAGWGGTSQTLARPSVWRGKATAVIKKYDSPAAGGVSDFEAPAFLRIQRDDHQTSSRAKAAATPAGRPRAEAPRVSAAQIFNYFNYAAAKGLAFRPALRAVTDLPPDNWLVQMIVSISQHAGGLINAWACYLHWLHEHSPHGQQLTPEALALVEGQLKSIDASTRLTMIQAFEMLTPTEN